CCVCGVLSPMVTGVPQISVCGVHPPMEMCRFALPACGTGMMVTNYSGFLEKGWGLGKGKTSFFVKRSFPLPQERSSLIKNFVFFYIFDL
ncbi:MAG: hypothetical protein IKD29_03215, partial [Lentisphaeria bacterium]|nr:hypothetical protein [Lentisphaeria bacterium]